eukprot:343368_1
MTTDVLYFEIGNGKKSLENHYWIYIGCENIAKLIWVFADGTAVLYGISGYVMVVYCVARYVSSRCCVINKATYAKDTCGKGKGTYDKGFMANGYMVKIYTDKEYMMKLYMMKEFMIKECLMKEDMINQFMVKKFMLTKYMIKHYIDKKHDKTACVQPVYCKGVYDGAKERGCDIKDYNRGGKK